MLDSEQTLRQINNLIPWKTAEIWRSSNQSDVGIIIFDVVKDPNGIIVDWTLKHANEEVLQATNQIAARLIDKRMTEIFGRIPQLMDLIQESNKVFEADKVSCFEVYFPENQHYYILRMTPQNNNQLFVVIIDITLLWRIKEDLHVSRELLENIIDSSPSKIFARDLSGNFTLVNQTFAQFHNMSKEQCIGKTYRDIFTQDILDAVASSEQKIITDGTPYEVEELFPCRGELRTYLTSKFPIRNTFGQINGIGAVLTDVTTIRKNEEIIKYHANLIESVSDAVISTDSNMIIRSWNHAAENIYGWTTGEALGKDARVLLNIELQNINYEDLANELMSKGCVEIEDVHTNKNNERLNVVIHISILKNQNGEITGTVSTIRDVTERKRTFEALEEANNQLLETDRQKNQFLAMLSHELRNPLASIQNCLSLLDNVTFTDERARYAKEVMDRQVAQLTHHVNDLLDITRITQNKVQLRLNRIEVNETVQNILKDYRLLFDKKGVDLDAELNSPLYIDADAIRLEQILGNILHNALKFTGNGDRVRLHIGCDLEQKKVIIRIADTGIGMTPDMLANLFQPFRQADTSLDRSLGGLGLGLALVKGLVELHGGQVFGFSGGSGQGSEFTIWLPLSESINADPQDEKPKHCSGSRRILIIDDNLDFCESLSELLKLQDHETDIAHNGVEGLMKARVFHPDIVLCDIGLPGMNGYEVAKAFRTDHELKEVRLIALTGYATPNDIFAALESGFDKHLAKPLDMIHLLETLEQLK